MIINNYGGDYHIIHGFQGRRIGRISLIGRIGRTYSCPAPFGRQQKPNLVFSKFIDPVIEFVPKALPFSLLNS